LLLSTHTTLQLSLCHSSLFNHPATPEIYTLSLHDALPIYNAAIGGPRHGRKHGGESCVAAENFQNHEALVGAGGGFTAMLPTMADRKSTRLNSSHDQISYAVFCLKKKNKITSIGPVLQGHT